MLVYSLLRSLGVVELGFVSEENLEKVRKFNYRITGFGEIVKKY